MSFFLLLVVILQLTGPANAWGNTTYALQAVAPPGARASSDRTQPVSPPALHRYTLPPEKRAKAIAYSRARYFLYFVDVALSLGIYFLLWRGKVAVVLREWARRVSVRHFAQCAVFVPLFVAAANLLRFPLDYYSGFVLEHRFDLSTQGFPSWLADWAKSLALTTVLGVFLVWGFYEIVRRSPRRWWLYSWLANIPVVLALIWIQPVVVDPLFYKFTPLDRTQPGFTARIGTMLRRAGIEIPASRMYEMDASTKTRTLDAYVTGVGASKRVVFYDNTLRKMTEDEALLVLGHETGHYVLNHILKGFALFEFGALVGFYLVFFLMERVVKRLGPHSGVEGVGDLASLPLLLLAATALSFLASPIYCAGSRYLEHQADQFGLEVAYGVVADPNGAEAQSLQVLGEEDLADPDPHPFIKFWLYTHPPLDERIRFAATYKPWAEGKPLEFVRPAQ